MRRGCGARRDPGTIYSTLLSRKRGDRHRKGLLKHFLFCPPWYIDPKQLGLSDSGVKIIQRIDGSGVYDIYDVIGRSHYPYWTDFFEEADEYGTSRKVARTAQFNLLSPESLHIYVYSWANIVDPTPFYEDRLDIMLCPRGHKHHDDPIKDFYEMCTGLLWEAVGDGASGPRGYKREIPVHRPKDEAPITSYFCGRPPGGIEVTFEFAALMKTPIEFEVTADPLSSAGDLAMEVLADANNNIYYEMVED